MNKPISFFIATLLGLVLSAPAVAADAKTESKILFTNVHVFDGK